MKPTGAERDGWEGRTADRTEASESNAVADLDPREQWHRFADQMSIR